MPLGTGSYLADLNKACKQVTNLATLNKLIIPCWLGTLAGQ